MNTVDRARKAAEDITRYLRGQYPVYRELLKSAEAAVVPSGKSASRSLLFINIHISAPNIVLSVLWNLTVPLMRSLAAAGMLREFWRIAVQISVSHQVSFERVIRVECLTTEVGHIPATQEHDLLDSEMWNDEQFTCYWYWSPQRFIVDI